MANPVPRGAAARPRAAVPLTAPGRHITRSQSQASQTPPAPVRAQDPPAPAGPLLPLLPNPNVHDAHDELPPYGPLQVQDHVDGVLSGANDAPFEQLDYVQALAALSPAPFVPPRKSLPLSMLFCTP